MRRQGHTEEAKFHGPQQQAAPRALGYRAKFAGQPFLQALIGLAASVITLEAYLQTVTTFFCELVAETAIDKTW